MRPEKEQIHTNEPWQGVSSTKLIEFSRLNAAMKNKIETITEILFLVVFLKRMLILHNLMLTRMYHLINEGSLHGTDCQRSYKKLIIRVPLQDSHVNTAVTGDIRTSNPVCSDVSMAFWFKHIYSNSFYINIHTQGQLLEGVECHIYLNCFTFDDIYLNRALVIIVNFQQNIAIRKCVQMI